MTSKVQKLQRACLRDPVKVEVAGKFATVDTLRQEYLFVPAKHKDCYAAYVLTELAGCTAMVFTRTCDATRRLALTLRALGFDAVPIHGNLSQPKRLGALNKFKSGERSLLVATDVASRGLDIPAVDLVLNYDVPANAKDYVHRVGRTARAGRSGRALTLVTQYDVRRRRPGALPRRGLCECRSHPHIRRWSCTRAWRRPSARSWTPFPRTRRPRCCCRSALARRSAWRRCRCARRTPSAAPAVDAAAAAARGPTGTRRPACWATEAGGGAAGAGAAGGGAAAAAAAAVGGASCAPRLCCFAPSHDAAISQK